MARTIHKTDNVTLEGFQAVLSPSKFGYSLSAVVDGSTVKLGFYQKPYILRDGVTYGSSLKLVGVQVVSVKGDAGVDTGDLDANEVAELFGKSSGFKTADPNVTPTTNETETEEEDF